MTKISLLKCLNKYRKQGVYIMVEQSQSMIDVVEKEFKMHVIDKIIPESAKLSHMNRINHNEWGVSIIKCREINADERVADVLGFAGGNIKLTRPRDHLISTGISRSLHSPVTGRNVAIRSTFSPREPRAVNNGILQLFVVSWAFAGLRMLYESSL